MFIKKFIGWIALALFIITGMMLGFLILLTFNPFVDVDAQFILLVAGVLALAAAILGFYASSTSPGKVGGIGGLALSILVTIVLTITTIVHVQLGNAQQLPVSLTTTPMPSATAVLANATAMPASTATQAVRDTQTYHNSYVGFELDYPSGWLVDASNEASGTVILWSRKVEGPGRDGVPADVVKIDIVNPVSTAKSLDELVDWQKQIIADSSHEVLDEQSVRLPSGLEAVKLDVSGIGEALVLLTMVNSQPLIIVEYGDLSRFTEVTQTLRPVSPSSQATPSIYKVAMLNSRVWEHE